MPLTFEPLPVFTIASRDVGGPESMEEFRRSVADLFAATPIGDAPHRVDLTATHLGNLLLSEVSSSPLAFSRTDELIATVGIDHILVQLYVEGGYEGHAGDAAIAVRPGDVCFLDLLQPIETRATAFTNITCVVPREMLEAQVDSVDGLHGLVLERELANTRMLASHLKSLLLHARSLTPIDAKSAARATVALVAGLVGQRPAAHRPSAIYSSMRQILRHIEANLADSTLTPLSIAQQCGVSRSQLYRMFGCYGGVSELIRARRLRGAALDLVSAANGDRRIGEIARDWGFDDYSTFNRAFRARFDMSPAQARDRSSEMWESLSTSSAVPAAGTELSHWLRTVSRL